MAASNSYLRPGIVERFGTARDIVDKTIDLIIERANRVPLEGAKFFRSVDASKIRSDEYKESTTSNVLDLPPENNDSEDIPYDSPAPGFPQTFSILNYRLGTRVERQTQEDQIRPGELNSALGGLINAAQRRVEYALASIFNNGFTGTAGADSLSLFNDSHPQENNEGGTWDNLETAAALSASAFETARINMMNQTNERGDPMPITGNQLIVSPSDMHEARRILRSDQQPGNALNDANVHRNDFTLTVYNWTTSTTAWFLRGDLPQDQWGIVFVNKVPMNVAPSNDPSNPDILMAERVRMRFAVGFTTERNMNGNAGV